MPNVVSASEGDDLVIGYRLSWMSALTGYDANAKTYPKDIAGRAGLFKDLLKCDSIPTILVTNDAQGGLPAKTDLMVNHVDGISRGRGVNDAVFELIAPLTGMVYNGTAEAILQQVRFVILPVEGNLSPPDPKSGLYPPAAPPDIESQLRGKGSTLTASGACHA
jgi:hypothetical protein